MLSLHLNHSNFLFKDLKYCPFISFLLWQHPLHEKKQIPLRTPKGLPKRKVITNYQQINCYKLRKRIFLMITGEIFLMSPITTTTAMETKTNRWFNAWTTPIADILDGSKKNVESTIEEGICLRVIPDVHGSFYGPYLNGVITKDGQERVFLICLESSSDYSYATGIALKGEYIKPCKKDRTGKLFTKSFDDLLDVNARNRLKAIAAGSGDEVVTTADSKEGLVDEVAAAPPAPTTGTPPAPATGEETEAKNEVLDLEVSDQEDNLNLLENLMATATQKCHDLGLPMFIGICLPPKKYKK